MPVTGHVGQVELGLSLRPPLSKRGTNGRDPLSPLTNTIDSPPH
jgi:hypothetical protein